MVARYRKEVLVHKLKTTENQKLYLKWWEAELGHYTLADLTSDLIVTSRNKLIGMKNRFSRTIGSTTANRYATALGHVFSVAVNEWGWVESSPFRYIKKYEKPRGRVRFLDEKELPALLDACKASRNPYLYAIVIAAVSTGARKSEITGLRWKDVDLKRKQVVFHETKNNERRVIPLRGKALITFRELHNTWSELPKDGRSQYVFPSETKNQPVDIKKAWQHCVEKSELNDFRFHDLRHTAASYFAQNGATLADIAAVLGHKTLQMVKRYAHLTEAHTHSVVDKMNERFLSNV